MQNSIFFIIAILLCSCNGNFCPDDRKVGDLALSSTTQSFNPYNSESRLVFENEMGDSLVFKATNGLEESFDRLCIKELCTEPQIKGNTTCEYYESEANRLVFFSEDQNATIDFLLFSDVVTKDQAAFFQAMRIGFSQVNAFAQAGILSDSINATNINRRNISVQHYFSFVGDIELNGRAFENVYVFEEFSVAIYYNKEKGLVGFDANDVVWALRY
ncbi:MAG: hypothetical protein AAF806_23850 [Bacteroidota bacterium]